MSYFDTRPHGSDSILEVFSSIKPSNARKLYRDYFMPEISPSERRMNPQRLIKHSQRAQIDLQNFKNIIEKSLIEAKNNRQTMKNLSKKLLQEPTKETIKSFNIQHKNLDENKSKYSALSKFINIQPTKFRKIRPKSPVNIEKSIVVSKFNSNHEIGKKHHSIHIKKPYEFESDEDKMDSKLDMYYL